MIQPELFSDSHQAFEYFRKVTSVTHFVRSKEVVRPPWLWILFFAWLVTIWIVHFFPSVVHVLALTVHLPNLPGLDFSRTTGDQRLSATLS
jgi:hypothetical protein